MRQSRVLKQLGYAQTSLRDIAAHGGVAVGTLHYHFADKAALMDFSRAALQDRLSGRDGRDSRRRDA